MTIRSWGDIHNRRHEQRADERDTATEVLLTGVDQEDERISDETLMLDALQESVEGNEPVEPNPLISVEGD